MAGWVDWEKALLGRSVTAPPLAAAEGVVLAWPSLRNEPRACCSELGAVPCNASETLAGPCTCEKYFLFYNCD